jgi:magnesium-dependent phosphatase-1
MRRKPRAKIPFILFLDLDGTLWTHKDVSSMKPPFQQIDNMTVTDSSGQTLRVYSEMLELIDWAKSIGAIVSSLSWNIPDKAVEVLKLLGLYDLFDYHAIEPHPNKNEYMKKVLHLVAREYGRTFKPCEIVYIDDRTIHLEDILRSIGKIVFIQADECRRDIEACKKRILDATSKCTHSSSKLNSQK